MLPNGEGRAPLGNVIILSAEDDVADTIRPRLEVAGADLTRVHAITAVKLKNNGRRTFDLTQDIARLEQAVTTATTIAGTDGEIDQPIWRVGDLGIADDAVDADRDLDRWRRQDHAAFAAHVDARTEARGGNQLTRGSPENLRVQR